MQQHTQHILETVVQENSHSVYGLSAQMIQLKTVQNEVARLLNKLDDITHKGWHEDRGLACISILQIQDSVRLIDMAFYPLFKEMSQEVDTLNIHAQELFETVIENESEQSSRATPKLDINSVEGWNAFAMEGNIKTFTKEFGREPESFEEVLTYITETVNKVMDKNEENKKADALTSTNENIAN
ncbi:hypothetical protein FJQ98_19315 [Lysinibacillus agricola]|uniref:LXG domain-containing protein n=1 Tax=Lysinibacillus agricola TaxID=2590012 RepID=A0ABX7AR04_9BACI|nr:MULTISPECIES: hypothetical protein [Lysinibacillus]KOS61960.1 hypothetical protein AN161_15540 [Lysinibacillus sp. FJAT-14222]QQP11343.1 hypothetical protein FJQ98_19315 [Lysinibacillus agricola]